MTSHLIVTMLVCSLACEPVDVRIWDGDTLRLGMTSEAEAIRILNIDTPEIEGKCSYEIDLAFQAKARLGEILEGQPVEIVRDSVDRYGRTLAVLRINGRDVGDQLVAEGLARTWSGRREGWC